MGGERQDWTWEDKGGAGGAVRVLTKVVKGGRKETRIEGMLRREKFPRHGRRQIELDSWLRPGPRSHNLEEEGIWGNGGELHKHFRRRSVCLGLGFPRCRM